MSRYTGPSWKISRRLEASHCQAQEKKLARRPLRTRSTWT